MTPVHFIYPNLYQYVGSRPLNMLDPRGEFCWLYINFIGMNIRNIFRDRGINGGGTGCENAFTHCYVACEIHSVFQSCSDAWDDREDGDSPDDLADLANNAVGRGCAKSGDCWRCCRERGQSGKFTCSDNNGLFQCRLPPNDDDDEWPDEMPPPRPKPWW